MPSCSTANMRPVRPKPVATSSQISSVPCWRASVAQARQISGRLRPHTRRALHERLDDQRRDFVAVRGKGPRRMVDGERERPLR